MSAVIFLVSAQYNLATAYIVGRVEVSDFGVAIAYSSVLILFMLATIGLISASRWRTTPNRATACTGDRRERYCMTIAADPAAVRLQKVSKSFGLVKAVDDIDLRIEPGTLVTLLGPSGCGKTTTLRMIAGLEESTSGKVLIGNLRRAVGSVTAFGNSRRRNPVMRPPACVGPGGC